MPDRSWRRYDAYAIVLVYAGEGRYRDTEGRDLAIEAGDAILVRPGVPHWYGPSGAHWSELFVVFAGPLFDLLLSDPGEPVRRLDPIETWMARLEDLFRGPPSDPAARVLAFASLLAAMLAAEPNAEAGDPIALARALLAEDVTAKLGLDAVAARCGLGYETFRRRFAREVGVSPGRYRDERRIETAAELLTSTRRTHREIAAMLGFADEYHFSKRFRALAGQAPSALRPLRR
jgi:AraC-like DNA-binding protein